MPGCRTPHVWLSDGVSLYDVHGAGYCLLRFDPTINVEALILAAATRGVPLKIIDIDPALRGEMYDRHLVLSRPDLHVAWRGDAVPADPLALIDQVRGVPPKICE